MGFDTRNHSKLKEHEQSKTAVVLTNAKENSGDVMFNQQSMLRVAPPFDIDFDYLESNVSSAQSATPIEQPPVTITLKELPDLKVNQKVNVTATISLGADNPKPITLKKTQKITKVKEDCILEDETGTATIHIWDELIAKVESGSTYEFTDVAVKQFKGKTHLGTTKVTTIKKANNKIEAQKGPELLKNPEREVKAEKFKLINKLSIVKIVKGRSQRPLTNNISSARSVEYDSATWTAREMHLSNSKLK